MWSVNWPREDLDSAYINERIHYWANHIVNTHKLDEEDIKDISQELAKVLIINLQKYDSTRASRETFISRIIENRARTLVKARAAAKRKQSQEAYSLDDLIEPNDSDSESYQCNLSEDGIREKRPAFTAEETNRDLAEAIAEVMRQMPETLQVVCEKLYEGFSPTEIARDVGINRSTVYDRREKIRCRMREGGIK